jgi:phage tail-like protein
MKTGDLIDPTSDVRFAIEIGGEIVAWFMECSGLNAQRDVTPHPEGGINDYVHQLPGRIKHNNITLKRGVTNEEVLWKWFQEGLYDGKVKRQNVSIILFSTDRKKGKRWNLREAYPAKWTGPNLKSDSNGIAVETLELVHHGFEMTGWTDL